jgi:integrase
MSRSVKLTWQVGRDGRSGRWRKKYKGKTYYFPGGNGKSDREAYDTAVKQWEQTKVRLDGAEPRKHQVEYESELKSWDQVYSWALQHGDTSVAQTAYEKRAELRSRMEAPVLKPLSRDDRFLATLTPRVDQLSVPSTESVAKSLLDEQVRSEIGKSFLRVIESQKKEAKGKSKSVPIDESIPITGFGYSELISKIWEDRLANFTRRETLPNQRLGDHVDRFLGEKQQETTRGDLSIGRFNSIKRHMQLFNDWMGPDSALSDIDGNRLREYHQHLLGQVSKNSCRRIANPKFASSFPISQVTAKERLATVKAFVKWLWEIEAIQDLPRAIGSNSKTLRITADTVPVVIFEDQEIAQLLNEASGRTKLFILLMLTCGMTQKDIADLKKSEVDLNAGRIIRKRSKTESFGSVPTVNYLLWPETLTLLRKYFNKKAGDHALLNGRGATLWQEGLDQPGKYTKSDNIRNAFFRVLKKLGINKPLKSLKKTSSSKLRDHERYSGLEDLFLGHAPQKMSDKHYTTAPQKLFDAAISWLATQYGLAAPLAER